MCKEEGWWNMWRKRIELCMLSNSHVIKTKRKKSSSQWFKKKNLEQLVKGSFICSPVSLSQPAKRKVKVQTNEIRQKRKKKLKLTVEVLPALVGIDWSRKVAGDVGVFGREGFVPGSVFIALRVPAGNGCCGVETVIVLVELLPVELTITVPTNWLLLDVVEMTPEEGVEEETVETREELTTWLLLFTDRAEVDDKEGELCSCCAIEMDVVVALLGTTGVPVAAVGAGDGIPTLNIWNCPLSVLTRRWPCAPVWNAPGKACRVIGCTTHTKHIH
jgi:hypothetical protein